MSATARAERPPSAFALERYRFHVLFKKYREHWLNEFFDLSLYGASRRRVWVMGVLLAVAVINGLANFSVLVSHFKVILPAILSAGSTPIDLPNEFLFVLTVIGYVCIPYYVSQYFAIEMSADYLTDIFELKNTDIARTFIRQLSLEGAVHAIHVRGGKIVERDLESPIIKIGGPGRVIVDFDSAVLFERADGTAHIIGPNRNSGEADGEEEYESIDIAILDGFERFREAIDLRDHYIGNPSGEPLTIKGFSLDGMPVSATDVRAVYSVQRNESKTSRKTPTRVMPYPYVDRAIEDLVYQSTARVLPEGPYPSDLPSHWTNTAQGMIRSAIGEFMSGSKLGEYLSSFGAPEVEVAESHERTIQFRRFEITADISSTTKPIEIAQPKFRPRTELSANFSQLSDRFTKRINERGVDLHWIGVGTWTIPDKIASEIINGQLIEAWQINRENISRGSSGALQSVFDEAYINQKLHLIQTVPIAAYKTIEKDKSKNGPRTMLMAYWELFGSGADLYYNASDPLSKELEEAIGIVEEILFGGDHFIGERPTKLHSQPIEVEENRPPAPQTHNEGKIYAQLLRLLDGDYLKAEWLIEYETQKVQGSSREQTIQYLLDHPELCNI